jgi:hypothetical protein
VLLGNGYVVYVADEQVMSRQNNEGELDRNR